MAEVGGDCEVWTSQLLRERAPFVRFGVSRYEHGNMAYAGPGRESEVKEVVDVRRARVFEQIGLPMYLEPPMLVAPRPVHGDSIVDVPADGMVHRPEGDIAVTWGRSILMYNPADCLVVPIVDVRRYVVALVHAGYVGVGLDVLGKTVHYMRTVYGSSPGDLLAVLPPSWQGPNGEGSWLPSRGSRIADAAWDEYIVSGDEEAVCLRWVDRGYDQLLAAGLHADNIERSLIDTATSGEFFSHHRWNQNLQPIDGRHTCVLAMVG